jgi:hypothetical protein
MMRAADLREPRGFVPRAAGASQRRFARIAQRKSAGPV